MPIYSYKQLNNFYANQNARVLSGTAQYMSILKSVVINPPYSMACWFSVRTNTFSNLMSFGGINDGNTTAKMFIGAGAGSQLGCVSVDSVSTSGEADTVNSYVVNKPNHACAVYGSSSFRKIYLNGPNGSVTSGTTINTVAINRTSIGVSIEGGTAFNPFAGNIWWPFFWNIALTDNEVLLLSGGLAPWFMHPENIVAGPQMNTLFDPFTNQRWIKTGASTLIAPNKQVRIPKQFYMPKILTQTSNIKAINGLIKGNVKAINGLAIGSMKSWDGLQ